jgi:ClpP class serine protease
MRVPDSTVPTSDADDQQSQSAHTDQSSSKVAQFPGPQLRERDLNDRLLADLIDAVKGILRKETSERLRDVYVVGDIEKDTARSAIERLREMANDSDRPITVYINSAGGNVTDGLAIHDTIRQIVHRGVEVTIVVRGWPTRWARSCCRRPAPAAGSRCRIRGS